MSNNIAGSNQRRGSLTLLVGAPKGAVASGGFPLGAYLVISKDLGGMFGWGAHFFYSSVNSR